MSYIKQKVHVSDSQLQKLRRASKNKEKTSITINLSLPPNFELYLTKTQINKLKKGPRRIELSPTQLTKNGGFIFTLGSILAGIGAAAGIASAASNIAKAVNTKKSETAMIQEQVRHNQEVENLLKAKNVVGQGAYLPKKYTRLGAGVNKKNH